MDYKPKTNSKTKENVSAVINMLLCYYTSHKKCMANHVTMNPGHCRTNARPLSSPQMIFVLLSVLFNYENNKGCHTRTPLTKVRLHQSQLTLTIS